MLSWKIIMHGDRDNYSLVNPSGQLKYVGPEFPLPRCADLIPPGARVEYFRPFGTEVKKITLSEAW